MNPPHESCTAIDGEIFCYAMLANKNEGMIYSDLMGKFPLQSFDGHLYLFICYIYSASYIIMRPMWNRKDKTIVKTLKYVYNFLKTWKYSPKIHVLDNECSKAVRAYITGEDTKIQLVEPHNHRVNASETAIKSVKYHMIVGLQTVDPDFLLQMWSEFVEQF